MTAFTSFPEQPEAKRLLAAALAEGPVHAYLFHGPRGVGKRLAAREFAAELIGDRERVQRGAHPDLYVLEPLGDQIRIGAVRELRRDLHMRPFEAPRRVYLILSAHLLNDEAADALLKDLEEPPPYAVIVLVADELGPVAQTIQSRCQAVPFRRLSPAAIRAEVDARAPGLTPEGAAAVARASGGRLDRLERLLEPRAAARRAGILELARAAYADPEFDPAAAADRVVAAVDERAAQAREAEERTLEGLDLPGREAEQRARRASFGASREEVLAELDDLAGWYRDLVVVAAGARATVVNVDRLAELERDSTPARAVAAERAAELVRASWREFEEFNLDTRLALHALFVQLRRVLAAPAAVAA